ncbi:hypothetical protein [Arthrobacter psychrolactophilus]|uniref:hypothetical protein n=1 Tax=Arthrobacter psychrolactophilus TaxID=92442 RepID=UPI001C645C8B|nr:hypothetical protein [Arthrobacter psychrolactophilus]
MTGIDDRRTAGTPHDLEFLGELRPEQKQALQAIDSIEQGILVAPRAPARRSLPARPWPTTEFPR